MTTPSDEEAESLDNLASHADVSKEDKPDPITRILLPSGPPTDPDEKSQLFELYKIMVGTSEALVARRQGTNTFFLTINGLLLTTIGLFVHQGSSVRSRALVIAILCVTGLIISWGWHTLIRSFGQLNKGKFAVILRLEKALSAAIFDAEWEALDRGENKKTYRSFTQSESRIPLIFMIVYMIAGIASLAIAIK